MSTLPRDGKGLRERGEVPLPLWSAPAGLSRHEGRHLAAATHETISVLHHELVRADEGAACRDHELVGVSVGNAMMDEPDEGRRAGARHSGEAVKEDVLVCPRLAIDGPPEWR